MSIPLERTTAIILLFRKPVKHTHLIKTIADPDRDGLRRVSTIHHLDPELGTILLHHKKGKQEPSSLGHLAGPPARRSPHRLVII